MDTDLKLRVAFWILFGGVMVMRIYFSIQVRRAGERLMPNKQAIEREGRGMFTARVLMFFIILAWLVLYVVYPAWMDKLLIPIPAKLRWVGFGLGLVSLGFWTWTQVALGKEWSPQLQLREEHHLVTTGPYAHIRHPLYTGMMGYGASLALVTANWVFVALAAFMIAGSVARAPREEQMMTQEFGEEYIAYIQKTGKFFPKR
jgi:protein-S-isoprenylcysteine O-methyltransferase Ste14